VPPPFVLGKLLPAVSGEEYEYAKADIHKYGQRDAIITPTR